MSNTPADRRAMKELSAHLSALRDELPADQRSWRYIADRIKSEHRIEISFETVRKMHLGMVDPNKVQYDYLLGIALFYGRNGKPADSSKLGPAAAARIGNLLELAQNWKELTPLLPAA